MISSRQKLILKAIVDIFSETAEPVGSKVLMDLPYLNYSSATLRYDMATLEEMGFLEKTHTSSGRVPSEKGYRYYVDHLVTRDSDVVRVFPMIDEIFNRNSFTRETTIKEALKLLTELTNYTAVAVGPDVLQSKIKKVDFIPLGLTDAVVLIVTDRGHVQHQQIHIKDGMSINDLKEVIKTLDDLLQNRLLSDAIKILKEEYAASELNQFMDYQAQIIDSFIQAFSKFASDSFYLSGMTNVFEQPEFNNLDHIKRFIDMMDRREIIKLIGTEEGLTVRFGSDMQIKPLNQMTVVSIPYRINENESGTIALLGPTRMAYQKVIPLLEYIAANLAKLYKDEKE
ncbi:Heat-inducible transcription repressor HrcA [Acholeplasma oculi]|uniref:Heat-inducible transcription repressor HrcA n=1 Tax=Acholeplasma oculi TaxID=35623 RepID=A0A061ABI1_9MOLU|nr:heat-inducible transcriptional repressor HrcA [Acholeplasma oculi]CDR30759.1 Heat-inducible transcription repressor HrcA [Acholeplasma oculi]SKC34870.1 heat-inducible transcription repressor HrcA [Acholeplasma oculi]SUT89671.1 Heat-inducible transcription repressor HrcA [Acholeplasma oculi]